MEAKESKPKLKSHSVLVKLSDRLDIVWDKFFNPKIASFIGMKSNFFQYTPVKGGLRLDDEGSEFNCHFYCYEKPISSLIKVGTMNDYGNYRTLINQVMAINGAPIERKFFIKYNVFEDTSEYVTYIEEEISYENIRSKTGDNLIIYDGNNSYDSDKTTKRSLDNFTLFIKYFDEYIKSSQEIRSLRETGIIIRSIQQLWKIAQNIKNSLNIIWQNKSNDYLITEEHNDEDNLGKYTLYNKKTRTQSVIIIKGIEFKKEIDYTLNITYEEPLDVHGELIPIYYEIKVIKLDNSSSFISIEIQYSYKVKFELETQVSARLRHYIRKIKKRIERATLFVVEDSQPKI